MGNGVSYQEGIGPFTPFKKQRENLDEETASLTYKQFAQIQYFRIATTILWVVFLIIFTVWWHRDGCQVRLGVHHTKIIASGDPRVYTARTWALTEWTLGGYLMFMSTTSIIVTLGALFFTVNEYNQSSADLDDFPVDPAVHFLLAFGQGIAWAMTAHLSGVISWAGILFTFFAWFFLQYFSYFIERKEGTGTEWGIHFVGTVGYWIILIIQLVYTVEDNNHAPRYPRFWLGLVITQFVSSFLLWLGFSVWYWTSHSSEKKTSGVANGSKPENYKYLTWWREAWWIVTGIVFFILYTWGVWGELAIC